MLIIPNINDCYHVSIPVECLARFASVKTLKLIGSLIEFISPFFCIFRRYKTKALINVTIKLEIEAWDRGSENDGDEGDDENDDFPREHMELDRYSIESNGVTCVFTTLKKL